MRSSRRSFRYATFRHARQADRWWFVTGPRVCRWYDLLIVGVALGMAITVILHAAGCEP